MMAWFGFIKKFATALSVKAPGEKKNGSIVRTAAVILSLIRDYKIDSIEKIEDAFVQEAETEVSHGQAEVELLVSEAAEKHAAAEHKLAQAAKVKAEGKAIEMDAETRRIKAVADATAKLLDAIAKIKRAGGSVVFLESELAALLRSGVPRVSEPEPLVAEISNVQVDHFKPVTASGSGYHTFVAHGHHAPSEGWPADIKFECLRCGQRIVVDRSAAGQKSNCPACEAELTVPSAKAEF